MINDQSKLKQLEFKKFAYSRFSVMLQMHIQFDDRATQLFEYPSEASMLADTTSTAPSLPFTVPSSSSAVTGNTSGHPVLMLPGIAESSLINNTTKRIFSNNRENRSHNYCCLTQRVGYFSKV